MSFGEEASRREQSPRRRHRAAQKIDPGDQPETGRRESNLFARRRGPSGLSFWNFCGHFGIHLGAPRQNRCFLKTLCLL